MNFSGLASAGETQNAELEDSYKMNFISVVKSVYNYRDMVQVASPLTSRFMELEGDMSIKAKAEVVIEHVQRKLEKGINVHILKINKFFSLMSTLSK